jgi:aminoglycoside phosphotransferase (APT) family kinase protein
VAAHPGGRSPSPPGLDLDRVAPYLAEAMPIDLGKGLTASVIAGGKSNLTYVVSAGSTPVVLRRPPLGHVLPSAHDMVREFRVISAMSRAGFPVPTPLLLCEDPDVIGAPFYLMSHVDGVVLRTEADNARLTPDLARHCGRNLVDVLLALHRIDPVAVGLEGFGRPEGYLQRQLTRWHQQWERSKTRELPLLEQVTEGLSTSIPSPSAGGSAVGIVHGDYRLDNVMFDHGLTQVEAVLDWEMATLGDPLADVGLFVVYTNLTAQGLSLTTAQLGPEQGFPTATELAEWYARGSGIPLDRLDWYIALGYYKLAVIGEGIHARYLQGKTVGEGFEALGARVPYLVEQAREALAR